MLAEATTADRDSYRTDMESLLARVAASTWWTKELAVEGGYMIHTYTALRSIRADSCRCS